MNASFESSSVQLSTQNHDRDLFGLRYVYPVVSRRSQGLSLGVNLNPNNACNWQCVYCQVPQLTRGMAPMIDLAQLSQELDLMLEAIVYGSFMQEHVPASCRRLNDIALSGNGEPTSCKQFDDVCRLIEEKRQAYQIDASVQWVLITNGSWLHRPEVQAGLRRMAKHCGEVWFKLDAASAELAAAINGVRLSAEQSLQQLAYSVQACPTWLQTCMFKQDGVYPSVALLEAYFDYLQQASSYRLEGILLYTLARPSMQAGEAALAPVDKAWMQTLAQQIQQRFGLLVRVHA